MGNNSTSWRLNKTLLVLMSQKTRHNLSHFLETNPDYQQRTLMPSVGTGKDGKEAVVTRINI